jgi:hypothetical protein
MSKQTYRFDVFGRSIEVARERDNWVPYLLGQEGKRRRADFIIPAFVAGDELLQYLDDLFHESASPSRPAVVQRNEDQTR